MFENIALKYTILSHLRTQKILILYPLHGIMQAALPDINNRLIKHTNEYYRAIREENYILVAICIEACISDLPEEYKLEINTAKYNELIRGVRTIECPNCSREIPDASARPYNRLLSNNESLLLGKRFMKSWVCPECSKVNPFYLSKKYLTMKDKHDYFQVIPEPPTKTGIHDRVGRTYQWKEWIDICLKELEHQIMRYRTEYAAQQHGQDVVEDFEGDE